jgi:hypothetical protein
MRAFFVSKPVDHEKFRHFRNRVDDLEAMGR